MQIEEKIPIYSGKPEDFHWAGFGSGSGTNLRECAKVITPSLIFSDRPSASLFDLEELSLGRGVMKESINGYKSCGSWKKAQGNSQLKSEYQERSLEFNQAIVDLLHKYEEIQEAPFDLVVLGGYMRLVMEPLLEAYKDKIINVHPADLSIVKQHEKVVDGIPEFYRVFVGDNAVYDVVKAGETSTKSSVIMVDKGVDHGEILTQGPEVEVWHEFLQGTDAEREECLREYADAHQSMQKVRSDWPALTGALEMIANGRIALGTENIHHNEWRGVYVDDKVMPYEGFQRAA
ncbi:hypothetical protein CEE44_01695 [Candidatus Woesearchaeota archaeon B3_Woes]|nr:MAG: hypothetical protein CEE44_01695 [Candidatus Woesearchaeota archaeon B3_Woes]